MECEPGSVTVPRLTGGVSRHLNNALALFADLSGVEGSNPDGHFHRRSGHDESSLELAAGGETQAEFHLYRAGHSDLHNKHLSKIQSSVILQKRSLVFCVRPKVDSFRYTNK